MKSLVCAISLYLCFALQLTATDATDATKIPEPRSIFVYCASDYNVAFNKFKSQYKQQLREEQFKWKVKGSKNASLQQINTNIEKELLQHKADIYILACGINEHQRWL